MRVSYKGKSILFMGDAVGRHNTDSDGNQNEDTDQLIATEKFLVDNSDSLIIDSDVLIASHHGANNGSAPKFIKAVSPQWVIFSAGRGHAHPRDLTAKRFIAAGVDSDKLLRTDLGDDESEYEHGDLEWPKGRIDDHRDPPRDDDLLISIGSSGSLTVGSDSAPCP